MRTVADVSTDDLVNSLLNSVTSASSDSASTTTSTDSASSPSSASASSASHSDSSSSSSSTSGTPAPKTTSPATTSPATTKPSTSSASASASGSSETATRGANSSSSDDDSSGGGGAALSIGIAIGVLALVVATLLFLRSRRRRAQKSRESASSPPTGATCLTVPADRGFKHERELGMPEMSIELPPGQLGFSKGLDMSYASSARSSAASQPYNPSIASSTDSSVFNTQGGVSPTFSNRKMASYSYQYRASSDGENGANPSLSSQRSNDSTTFHLTGLIGNGNTASNRGGKGDVTRGRKLSAPDEYAELVTATNAHGQMDMDAHSSKNQPQALHADFTKSAASQNGRGLGPDADNHSFLAPLPTRTVPVPVREPSVVRASEESMGPDSPVAGRGKRTGSVYDTIPKLSGEKITASFIRSSEEDPNAMSTASFLSESSISSTSTRDSVATSARGSAYVSSMPLLQQLSSADDSDYGEDHSSERASTDSTDSGNTTRSGSLIAMNLEAKDGCSEIAI